MLSTALSWFLQTFEQPPPKVGLIFVSVFPFSFCTENGRRVCVGVELRGAAWGDRVKWMMSVKGHAHHFLSRRSVPHLAQSITHLTSSWRHFADGTFDRHTPSHCLSACPPFDPDFHGCKSWISLAWTCKPVLRCYVNATFTSNICICLIHGNLCVVK